MRHLSLFTVALVLGMTLASLTLSSYPVQAATYYVDDDPASGCLGDGSAAQPYCAIQAGINTASSGDTVQVAAGTYYENITIKSGVVIQGAGQGVSIIDGTGSDWVVVLAPGVDSTATLDGFTITGGSSDLGGGMYNDSSSPTVTNCTFSGNYAGYHGGGMYNYSSSPTVTNCILWNDTPDEIYEGVPQTSVTFSDIGGGWPGTGNISADPKFVDQANGDLHLLQGSPCIDTGTSSGAPDTDLEGNPRPQGAGYDMGAYEFLLAKTAAMPWMLLLGY